MKLRSDGYYVNRHYCWKAYFWRLSYFLGTVSERTAQAVKAYIINQKEDPDSSTADS